MTMEQLVASWKERRALLARQLQMLESGEMRCSQPSSAGGYVR
jgi:hypothetical protein